MFNLLKLTVETNKYMGCYIISPSSAYLNPVINSSGDGDSTNQLEKDTPDKQSKNKSRRKQRISLDKGKEKEDISIDTRRKKYYLNQEVLNDINKAKTLWTIKNSNFKEWYTAILRKEHNILSWVNDEQVLKPIKKTKDQIYFGEWKNEIKSRKIIYKHEKAATILDVKLKYQDLYSQAAIYKKHDTKIAKLEARNNSNFFEDKTPKVRSKIIEIISRYDPTGLANDSKQKSILRSLHQRYSNVASSTKSLVFKAETLSIYEKSLPKRTLTEKMLKNITLTSEMIENITKEPLYSWTGKHRIYQRHEVWTTGDSVEKKTKYHLRIPFTQWWVDTRILNKDEKQGIITEFHLGYMEDPKNYIFSWFPATDVPRQIRPRAKLLSSLVNSTTSKDFNNSKIKILGPQFNFNIAEIQPNCIFPGSYKNNVQWGVVKPMAMDFKLDPVHMSTNQLNYAIAFYTYIDIYDIHKANFCQERASWMYAHKSLYESHCKSIIEEITKRNRIYHWNMYYFGTEYQEEVKLYTYLDKAWEELRIQHGEFLFENYKHFHDKNLSMNQWAYLKTPEKLYEAIWGSQRKLMRFPYCMPVWRLGRPIL